MEITCSHKREMNHTYVQFFGGTPCLEDYQVQMVLHGLVRGILPCSIHSMDNRVVWRCENTSRQSLSAFCQLHAFAGEELTWVWGGLFRILQEMQDYLLDAHSLYLHPDDIYLDLAEKQVFCCVVPFYEKNIWDALFELSQYFLGYLDHRDAGVVRVAYGIFRYLSQGGTSLEELWKLLHEKDEKAGPEPEGEKPGESMETSSRQLEQESRQIRQQDLDSFFRDTDNKKEQKHAPRFLWLLWFMPGGGAFLWALFLVFNFWYLNPMIKLSSAGAILILCGIGALFWFKLGRTPPNEDRPMWEDLPLPEDKPEILKYEDEETHPPEEVEHFHEEPVLIREEATVLLNTETTGQAAKLIQKESGETFSLKETPVVVGKMPGAVQLILASPAVSRIHARIFPGQEGYCVEDLNSKNGTYLNGKLMEARTPVHLQKDDILSFADVEYLFTE